MAGLFKTDEEVREFIENIGIEYKFSCLSEKNAEGCYLLGSWYESERYDYKKAFETYTKCCDQLNYSKCCDRAGSYYFKGKNTVDIDMRKATDYWIKGCYDTTGLTQRDPTLACYHGGQLLLGLDEKTTNFVKPEPDKGIAMLEKACKLRLPEACQTLNELLMSGNNYVSKDPAKAAEFGTIGCDYSNYVCCHNTYLMYKNGDGVPKDLEKAKQLRKKLKEIEYQSTHQAQFSQYTN